MTQDNQESNSQHDEPVEIKVDSVFQTLTFEILKEVKDNEQVRP